jgi:hypothetical protein
MLRPPPPSSPFMERGAGRSWTEPSFRPSERPPPRRGPFAVWRCLEEWSGHPDSEMGKDADPVTGNWHLSGARAPILNHPSPCSPMPLDSPATRGAAVTEDEQEPSHAADPGSRRRRPVPRHTVLDRWAREVYRRDRQGSLIRLSKDDWFFSRSVEARMPEPDFLEQPHLQQTEPSPSLSSGRVSRTVLSAGRS